MKFKSFDQFINEHIDFGDLTKDLEFLDQIRQTWGESYTDIEKKEHLNDGYCLQVANYMKKKYPEAEFYTLGTFIHYHIIVKIGDKFYDAVDSTGVDRIEDLQYAKEHPYDLENIQPGIAYDC